PDTRIRCLVPNYLTVSFYHFFLECSRTDRLLHAFPTRRSSDLPRAPTRRAAALRKHHRPARCGLGVASLTRVLAGRGGRKAQLRSEEHTSELQSLAYLVCRLLLEKKTGALSTDLRGRGAARPLN